MAPIESVDARYRRHMSNPDKAPMEWQQVPTTSDWALVENGRVLRYVSVREPYTGEPDGIKYQVTGEGHEVSVHDSLDEAFGAAQRTLL
jgi:hypothetical protein